MIFLKIKKVFYTFYKNLVNILKNLKNKIIKIKDYVKNKLNFIYLNLLNNLFFRRMIKILQKIYLVLWLKKNKEENIIKTEEYIKKELRNELIVIQPIDNKYIFNNHQELLIKPYMYLFGWFVLILLGSYTYQAEIILFFFPDLVISNLNLHFIYEMPFTFNNQIYYIIDDKISNIKYVKDYGYFFNKFDVNESV